MKTYCFPHPENAAEILRMERQGDGGLAPLPSSSSSAVRAVGGGQQRQRHQEQQEQQEQGAVATDASGRRKGLLRFVSEVLFVFCVMAVVVCCRLP
jgi:hypothetical protein